MQIKNRGIELQEQSPSKPVHERVKNSRSREIKKNTVFHGDYTLLIADIFYINIYSDALLFQVIPIDMKNFTNFNLRARSYQKYPTHH